VNLVSLDPMSPSSVLRALNPEEGPGGPID
jgi:hypothetical protein